MLSPIGFLAATSGLLQGDLTLTYINSGGSATDASSFTRSNTNLNGDAAVDNYIVYVVKTMNDTNSTPAHTDVTINGVSLTKLHEDEHLVSTTKGFRISIWGGYVALGSTVVDHVLSFGSNFNRMMYDVYKIRGSQTVNHTDIAKITGATGDGTFPASELATGECELYVEIHTSATSAITWTNATEDNENTSESIARSTVAKRQGPLASLAPSYASSGNDTLGLGIKFTKV